MRIRQSAVAVRLAFARFIRLYRLLLIILLIAMVVSWPGWWPTDGLGQNIASNIFGTFAVTPFVVFGVDRALRQAQQRREVARVGTIRAELKFFVGRIINAFVTPNLDAIPGLLDLFVRQVETKTMDNIDGVVLYLLENADAVRTALTNLEFEDYDRGLQNARRDLSALRQTLGIADDAVSPEDFALLWRTARELDTAEQSVALFRYAVREKMPLVKTDTGIDYMTKRGEEIADLVIRLSEWFLKFEIPD